MNKNLKIKTNIFDNNYKLLVTISDHMGLLSEMRELYLNEGDVDLAKKKEIDRSDLQKIIEGKYVDSSEKSMTQEVFLL